MFSSDGTTFRAHITALFTAIRVVLFGVDDDDDDVRACARAIDQCALMRLETITSQEWQKTSDLCQCLLVVLYVIQVFFRRGSLLHPFFTNFCQCKYFFVAFCVPLTLQVAILWVRVPRTRTVTFGSM